MPESAVVILVMGQAGCGKSTFVNSAAGKTVLKVNDKMESSSTTQYADCSHPSSSKVFTLVETPGFDNTKGKSDSVILVETATSLKERFSGVQFGGILYLQQRGQNRPMLTELIGNDVVKQNLLHVVTILGPGKGGSTQGDAEFPNTRGVSESDLKTSAWKIIDQVMTKVGPQNLTVGGFEPELNKAGGGERKDPGKTGGGKRRGWFSHLFR